MNFSLWRFTGVLLALGLAIQPTPSVAIGGHTAAHVEPYRPPHVDPPRPPPDRVVQPQEKRLDVDSLVSDAATPGANNESPARQQARLRNWKAITDSLGAETRDPAQAYLAVLVGNNGRALIATNLVRGNSSDRAVHEMTIGDLRDGVKLSAVLDSSLGGAEQSRGVALKFLVGSSVPSDKLRNFVQNDLRSFNLNSARFRFAELIPVGSDRAYSLERIDREAGEPRWLARLNECCVYGGIPPDVEGWSRLANIPFKSRGLQVVSLFADSQTSRELKRSGVALAVEHPEDIGDPAPILRQAFATGDADSPVIVIGHVEQGRFKIETADGGFIGVADVIAMARGSWSTRLLDRLLHGRSLQGRSGRCEGRLSGDEPVGNPSARIGFEAGVRHSKLFIAARLHGTDLGFEHVCLRTGRLRQEQLERDPRSRRRHVDRARRCQGHHRAVSCVHSLQIGGLPMNFQSCPGQI